MRVYDIHMHIYFLSKMYLINEIYKKLSKISRISNHKKSIRRFFKILKLHSKIAQNNLKIFTKIEQALNRREQS